MLLWKKGTYKVPAKKNCSPRHGSQTQPTFKKADLQNPYQIRRKEDEQPKENVNPSPHLSPRNRHGSCAFNPQSSPQYEVRPSTCTSTLPHFVSPFVSYCYLRLPFLFLFLPLVSSPVELQTAHPSPRSSPSSPESGSSCPNPLVSLLLVTVGQCQR
ncbi:hypothetical protein QR685DRAFT_570093 [Neurospora intermedia]|uniref:Uncharacterized protein n=1 Tax=Neurospora intermedia TaxID=5142 RepID=A0ABR3DNA4_NEUIN